MSDFGTKIDVLVDKSFNAGATAMQAHIAKFLQDKGWLATSRRN